MRYISLDIETGGLDPRSHDILEFGAIFEDTEVPTTFEDAPKFRCLFHREIYRLSAFCADMHKHLWPVLAGEAPQVGAHPCPIIPPENLPVHFQEALVSWGYRPNNQGEYHFAVAGKNVGTFDIPFLELQCRFDEKFRYGHRFVDPAMLYLDIERDRRPPATNVCMQRAGLEPTDSHTALGDAWDVIRLIRAKFDRDPDTGVPNE